jgi:hypothetical protein
MMHTTTLRAVSNFHEDGRSEPEIETARNQRAIQESHAQFKSQGGTMKENTSSKLLTGLCRSAIAIVAIGIAAAPGLHAKPNSNKASDKPANVVAHVELSGGPITRMLLVRKNGNEYLLLGLDSHVAVLDVTQPSQPRTVETVAGAAGAPATELKVIADTLTLFGTSDAESAASAGPKEIRSLSGVTAFVKDKAHGLIYVTNGDGLWILQTKKRADDEAQFYGSAG